MVGLRRVRSGRNNVLHRSKALKQAGPVQIRMIAAVQKAICLGHGRVVAQIRVRTEYDFNKADVGIVSSYIGDKGRERVAQVAHGR
jgi:hypothetical protein